MATLTRHPVSVGRLKQHLRDLGVTPGCVLLVHAAFSKVGPVEGGPQGLILALTDVLGRDGTLVMPSMSDDDERVFDPAATPCAGMGIVADTFWRQPGVLRSDSPHAFAAQGPAAAAIAAPHPVEVPHGPDSPVGRAHDLDGWILLLGVGHDANTTVHLAESLAGVRYRLPKSAMVLRGGAPVRVEYGEIDHCCQRFALVDEWLDQARAQRRGLVGHAAARLMRSKAVVTAVVEHVRADETVFLHPSGTDPECDAARASMALHEFSGVSPVMKNDFVAHCAISVDASPAHVWRALVSPRDIKRYMFGTNVESDWKVGGPIKWRGEWQGRAYEDKGVIKTFQPERRLQFTHFSPLTGLPDVPENYHTVTIELEPKDGGTRITLAQDNNPSEEARKHSEKNWDTMLVALKEFLELASAR